MDSQNQGTPQNAPQKINTKKIIFIIVGVFLLICVIGGTLAFLTTNKVVKEANAFVSALTRKDFDKAYTYFSPALKERQSLDAFKQALSPAPFNHSCTFEVSSRGSKATTDSGVTKKISGDITCGNAKYPTELDFIQTDQGDKLNAYSIKPAE